MLPEAKAPPGGGKRPGAGNLGMLWVVVLLELVSPVPLFLTFGAIYVLLVRPPWFRDLVRELYGEQG